MRYLIINADDFGLTDLVSAGIVESIREGPVSSTSAMVCCPGSLDCLLKWAPALEGHVGVHLQLTDGIPVCDPSLIPSLVKNGRFPRGRRELGIPDEDEIRREWHGQVKKILELGIRPVRLDTHHNVHLFAVAFKVFTEIAQTYNLYARSLSPRMTSRLRSLGINCPDILEENWSDETITVDNFILSVQRAFQRCSNQGIVEIMCHPGFYDEELERKSKQAITREKELAVLRSPELPVRLESLGIRLLKGAALPGAPGVGVPGEGTVSHAG
jgi:predicted glycoside hydrolase/deacetylase ChbG (UPF0249 family)